MMSLQLDCDRIGCASRFACGPHSSTAPTRVPLPCRRAGVRDTARPSNPRPARRARSTRKIIGEERVLKAGRCRGGRHAGPDELISQAQPGPAGGSKVRWLIAPHAAALYILIGIIDADIP